MHLEINILAEFILESNSPDIINSVDSIIF